MQTNIELVQLLNDLERARAEEQRVISVLHVISCTVRRLERRVEIAQQGGQATLSPVGVDLSTEDEAMGDRYPTFDPDVLDDRSGNSNFGWEMVTSGGFAGEATH